MDAYSIKFLEALVVTIGIETLLLWFLQRKKNPLKQLLGTGIVCSGATLPYVWFVLPQIISSFITFTIIAEISVFFIEAVMIKYLLSLNWKRAFVLSICCNAGSFFIGLLIF